MSYIWPFPFFDSSEWEKLIKEKLKRKWGLCRERFILDLGVVKCDQGEELSIGLYRHWQHHHTILLKHKRQHAVHEGALPHHLHHQHHGVWGEGLSIGGSWRCAAAKGNKELHQARTLQRNYDAKRRSLLRITVNHHNLSTFHWYILVLYCRTDLQLWLNVIYSWRTWILHVCGWLGAWIYSSPMKRAS